MTLMIDHPLADQLAQQLAEVTGEPVNDAVVTAIQQRLLREDGRGDLDALRQELRQIQQEYIRGLDPNAPGEDEILGYDEYGIPS